MSATGEKEGTVMHVYRGTIGVEVAASSAVAADKIVLSVADQVGHDYRVLLAWRIEAKAE